MGTGVTEKRDRGKQIGDGVFREKHRPQFVFSIKIGLLLGVTVLRKKL
jgi:hypothetical protein